MIKRLILPILLLAHTIATAQNMAIGSIDKGPYGKGSTIAVPLTISDDEGKLLPNNSFRLYLSDANGNFNREQLIGSYNSHYTTFVNGLLPSNLVPGNYRVRIKATQPAITTSVSTIFTVADATGLQASVDAPTQTLISNPKTFGSCTSGRANTRFNFTNTSTTGATVTASIYNGFTAQESKLLSFEGASTEPFIADIAHYTIFVKASLNGVIATQAFFIVNNTQNTPFSTFGSNTVCLPNGSLKYGVEISSASGIQSNFPGYTYRVNWGDQSIETYTFNQIKAAGGLVQHAYYKSSCGSQVVVGSVRYYNVFGIGMQLMSPFCNEIGTPVSTQAKVVTQPENRFGAPEYACLNTSITIPNISITGESPSATSPECNNNSVLYYWYVDDKLVSPAAGVPLSYALKHTFTTAGIHVIRLESESNSECQAVPIERPILIQNPPKPDFTLNGNLFCTGASIKTNNTSVVDNTGGAPNSFKWIIQGPSNPVFLNGTSATSENAEFKFNQPGVYTVILCALSSCAPIDTEIKTIVVNAPPTIIANWQTALCGKGQLLAFSNTLGNPVTTNFTGTFKEEPDTYLWEISGGKYEFRNGTTAYSKAPVIFFEEYGNYTLKITTQNNCGTSTLSKTLTFNESPTVSAGSDMAICAGATVQLNGTLSGPPVSSFSWTGGSGTFVPNRATLNAQYIPTKAEITAGQLQLSLTATTNIAAPCDKVSDIVVVKIYPPNKITSPAQSSICTGSEFRYIPTATIEGSTIKWTATGSYNAAGYQESGTGEIKDILSNTHPSSSATVTYTLIPEANGCPGEPLKLIVTISPLPAVKAMAASEVVCTGQKSAISFTPLITGTKYTWTSTATGAITGNTNQTQPTAASINETLINTGNTPGWVTYNITPVSPTGCQGESLSITLQVTAAPVIADAGSDQKVCNAGAIKLKANHPGSGNGKWTLISGQNGVSFDKDTQPDATLSGLQAGQVYRLKWTITGPGNCNASSDEVVVNNLSELANNRISAPGYLVCEGTKVSITGSLPTGGDPNEYTYVWENSTDGLTWTSINLQSQKNLDLVVTQTQFFRRRVSSGSCSNISEMVKIDVQEGISNNTISSEQHLCTGTIPARLQGSLPRGADGNYSYQWQQSYDGTNWILVVGATNITYQPPALTQTTYYRRVVTSAICTGNQQNESNSIRITVSKGARSNFNWISESACAPFVITKENIKAEVSETGDTYEWFADNKLIGNGLDFPGYTLPNAGDAVEIRLDVTSALGCGKTSFKHSFKTNNSLKAGFSTSVNQGCGNVVVAFNNQTLNTENVAFEWSFGNGQISYQKNPPAITYTSRADNKDTVYAVVLKARSTCVISLDTAYIRVFSKPAPRFSPSSVQGCSPLTVSFKNSSPSVASTYIWDYGDGTKETYTDNRSVKHTFVTGKSRTFTVKLTQRNACGEELSLSHTIKVAPNTIQPDLVVEAAQLAGCAPHTVKFYNYTIGAQSYTYIFNDGSDTIRTSSDDPVEHTFLKAGVYPVKLISSNCSDTTVIKTITVYQKATPGFTADNQEGCAPLTVKFQNQTRNAIQQIWDFGNGKTYTGANPPAQVYSAAQLNYTVKLITKSYYGCMDTLIMKDYIRIIAPAVAKFEVLPGDKIHYPDYRFQFKNTSTGEYSSLSWDWGDGSPASTVSDPEHSYPDTGTYTVKLTLTNKFGCSTVKERTVSITGTPGQLFVPNAFMPNSATEELRSFRAKGSGIEKWELRIFNKWGETLWTTSKLDAKGAPVETWDGTFNGTPVPQGVYFWEISAKFKNGNEWQGMSYNQQEPKKSGIIHLIR